MNLLFTESPKYYSNVADTMYDYREHEPTTGKPNSFIALEAFDHLIAVLLQQFFFGLDVSGCALMYFRQFIGADCGTDDGVLFRFGNGTADSVHDIVSTIFCRKQGIESSPFTLDGMLQTAVYAV